MIDFYILAYLLKRCDCAYLRDYFLYKSLIVKRMVLIQHLE